MTTIDTAELLTLTQAAERRGTTRQAVSYLVRQGKLGTVEIAGRLFIRRADVDNFAPDAGGRPTKAQTEVANITTPKRAAKTTAKKDGKR